MLNMGERFFYIFNNNLTGEERLLAWKKEYLRTGLILCDYKKQKTAEFLGITRKTVDNWLKAYPDLCLKFRDVDMNEDVVAEYIFENGKSYKVKDFAKKKIARIAKQFWFRQLSEEERIKIKLRILKQY